MRAQFDSGLFLDLYNKSSRTLTALSSQGQKESTVYVTTLNSFKFPYRGICIWTFCYWHFCKRWTSGHWAPNTVLPDSVQAELHQFRLPGTSPVHKQWGHLYWGPGSDRKGSKILSLQTCCFEHLLRLIRHGECATYSPAPHPTSWDLLECVSLFPLPFFYSCHLEWFLKLPTTCFSYLIRCHWYNRLPYIYNIPMYYLYLPEYISSGEKFWYFPSDIFPSYRYRNQGLENN